MTFLGLKWSLQSLELFFGVLFLIFKYLSHFFKASLSLIGKEYFGLFDCRHAKHFNFPTIFPPRLRFFLHLFCKCNKINLLEFSKFADQWFYKSYRFHELSSWHIVTKPTHIQINISFLKDLRSFEDLLSFVATLAHTLSFHTYHLSIFKKTSNFISVKQKMIIFVAQVYLLSLIFCLQAVSHWNRPTGF